MHTGGDVEIARERHRPTGYHTGWSLHQKLYEGNLDEHEITKAKAGQQKDFPKGIPPGCWAFCNKIFNATKFAMLRSLCLSPLLSGDVPTANDKVENWILHKLNLAAEVINKQLVERSFVNVNATDAAYNIWLYELCDVYIRIPRDHACEVLPKMQDNAYDSERDFDLVFSAFKSARALGASYNILSNDTGAQLFQSQAPTILALTTNLKSREVVRSIRGAPEYCRSGSPR
ncbi:hypothetical protein LXA43DRAFT_1064335 [Ganoderma leucocontextum]|nr:hypothetical protein LXA43DRAFT_1064335 [Ganoderma leucocontextum]